MNSKESTFVIQDKNLKDLDNAKEYSTLADLMKEQGVSTDLANYWDKECELNPSNPHCLVYEDQSDLDIEDITLFKKKLIMNLKRSMFSILNKDKKEIDYIKLVYKRRVQAEVDS